jgi:hypothetical protein
MEELTISEQDIVNAICLDMSQKHRTTPENVEVELMFEDDDGFSAETSINGRTQLLTSFDMIQSIRYWIGEVLHEDALAAGIQLVLDEEEGIVAVIR